MRKISDFKPPKMGYVVKPYVAFLFFAILLLQTNSTNSQTPSGLITNITATTGRSYTLGELIVGATVYTDRTYQATSVPAFLNNASFIKTPNDDKANKTASMLSFDLTQNAIVYVAYDPRATALPAWLSGWQKLVSQVGINDPKITHLDLYSKSYSAGTVTLGGNLASPAVGSQNNYLVVALVQTYNLTVTNNGNGAVTKNPDQATYANGTSVSLTATPASGQQFTGWSGDASGIVNPLTITMDADKSITATFAPIPSQYNLTVITTGNGSVIKNPDQATYDSGTSVSLTATPAAGEQFAGWSGDVTGSVNPLTITMDADKSITATFALIPAQYNLAVTSSGNGTVTKSPDQPTYTNGTNVSLTATPASGQQFTGWSGDASGSVNPLTVTMDADKSITAIFDTAPIDKSIYFTQSSQTAEVEQGGSQTLLDYISTSDNVPATAQLSAVDETGNIPTWLSVNGNILNGINYTTNSEISFDFDATNLSVGTYPAVITASAPGYNNAVLNILLTVKEGSTGVLTNIKVNFQDSATIPPAGWLRDFGQPFGPRSSAYQDSGYSYGWLKRSDRTPLDLTKNGRNRNTPSDVQQATLMHMQGNDITNFSGTRIEGVWEAQVANGNYDVTVSVGDGAQIDSKHSINVEGVSAISGFVPTTSVRFKSATVTVSVADGLLTIDAMGGVNSKINYIIIQPSTSKRPSVVAVNPGNSSQNVSENTSISTSILNLPNGGINNSTITTNNVYLTESGTGIVVPSNVNGTGGGDAITLVPSSPLKLNTTYNFYITDSVKDLSGASFIPYVSSFTTGSVSSSDVITAKFDKIDLPTATGQHSSLTMGPDGKLYALSIDGIIKRFPVNSDGTLGTPDSLFSLQDEYGTRQPRLAIGFAFDPSATASNLVAWVTHSTFVFLNGPSWDGKLTKLSGNNLQTVQDVLVNLPRSAKDHVTNSIAFGPDGALYFTQGSTSAMGKADKTWNNRNECLMSGAVLRLDVSKLGSLPLDVKTADGGGTYNPYAANAPLTIYASGVRNAYDLVWHSNGSLYCPTNGSAAGGNTPASVNGTLRTDGSVYNGPVVPALSNVQQTQKDFLFRVVKGGYYGHPNPLRGEYVMNGGNPTAAIDPAQVNDYPVGTMPDVNWRGYAFDFQNNASPDGAIEYKSNTFNGALKGKLLVVRYSQHDDIITLTPGGADNDIISSTEGISIPGFSGFNDPLNLTEDVNTGNIYVSEYGGSGKITLLRPNNTAAGVIAVNPLSIYDNDVAGGAAGINRTVTIKNTGSGILSISSISDTSSQFVLSGLPTLPKNINSGDSISFSVAFSPSSTGLKTGSVNINSNDTSNPSIAIPLRGLGTSGLGGANEPSLQSILNLLEYQANVGDDNVSTAVINSNTSLQKAALLGDEVSIQQFQKAGSGNVTITPLAVFGPTDSSTIVGMGWYKSGNTSSKSELFSVSNNPVSNGQTVNVNFNGTLSFDPVSDTFGFYSHWPFFNNRHLYSEDNLNTFTGAIPHHVRVYPYKRNGVLIPDSYLVAFEETTSALDYQDILFVVSNVKKFTPQSKPASESIDTILPLADAYVRDGTFGTTNYGSDTSLIVKGNTSSGFLRTSYLKFSLDNAITNVRSAKVRLYGLNKENTSTINLALFGVNDDSWTETGITFNNAPAPSSPPLSVVGVNNVADYYEFDVTNFVKAQVAGDKVVSVVVKDTLNQNRLVSFNSKENSSNPPQLVIDTTTFTPSNALLFVENPDMFPSNDHFVFSHIQIPWTRDSVYNANHDSLKVRIHNNGINPLIISNLKISTDSLFKIDKFNGVTYNSATQLPATISSGGVLELIVKLIAQNVATRAKVLNETLTITSNDDKFPVKKVFLNGLWQKSGESSHEPSAQEVLNTFGYKTKIGFGLTDPDKGDSTKLKGDEIKPDYFLRADSTLPVTIRQLAAYHSCCQSTESFRWFAKGTTTYTSAFTQIALDGQSLLPRKSKSTGAPAAGTITPSGAFGVIIGSSNSTDPSRNPGGKLGVRVYKALDASGNIIPNSYFLNNDYLGTTATNYDFNDNMYYVSNIKPYIGTVYYSPLNLTPSDLDFGEHVLQTTDSLQLNISSGGKIYSNGSQDPPIVISSVVITGENQSEFSAAMPVQTTLNPQEATTIKVKFNPATQGLKIADLLIYYNNSQSPKRVPLYGIAKASGVTVTANYRINSGASSPITINGKTWAADNQYSFDNLEPYKNPAVKQITATDEDSLYIDEQSSNGDKKPFRYQFPIANGDYYVRLHFAEVFWGSPGSGSTGGAGSRVFSVKMENQSRLINYDLSQDVGAAAAVIKNFPVTVTDGNLNIDFSATVNRPMVSAVEVYSFSSGAARPALAAAIQNNPVTTSASHMNAAAYDFEKPRLYPNPLHNKNFSIVFPGKYQGTYSLQLIDILGRKYDLGKTRLNEGGSTTKVDISKFSLKPGVYFLKINSTTNKADLLKLLIE